MSTPEMFVGIDVAKAHLDIALRPTGERWTVTNDDAGITALVGQLQALAPTLIVLEATGGYQRAVVAALAAGRFPVVVANPRQTRDFAKATGQLAKTDALDARALAHFAEAVRPRPRPLPTAQTEALRALLTRRRQLVAMRTAERNRLANAPPVSRPTSKPISPGSTNGLPRSTTSSTPPCETARSGGSVTPCTAVCRALGPGVHGRSCSSCQSWAC